jgi:hypothetical protein
MMEVVDPGREHCLEFDSRIDDGCIVLGGAPGSASGSMPRRSRRCGRIRRPAAAGFLSTP